MAVLSALRSTRRGSATHRLAQLTASCTTGASSRRAPTAAPHLVRPQRGGASAVSCARRRTVARHATRVTRQKNATRVCRALLIARYHRGAFGQHAISRVATARRSARGTSSSKRSTVACLVASSRSSTPTAATSVYSVDGTAPATAITRLGGHGLPARSLVVKTRSKPGNALCSARLRPSATHR